MGSEFGKWIDMESKKQLIWMKRHVEQHLRQERLKDLTVTAFNDIDLMLRYLYANGVLFVHLKKVRLTLPDVKVDTQRCLHLNKICDAWRKERLLRKPGYKMYSLYLKTVTHQQLSSLAQSQNLSQEDFLSELMRDVSAFKMRLRESFNDRIKRNAHSKKDSKGSDPDEQFALKNDIELLKQDLANEKARHEASRNTISILQSLLKARQEELSGLYMHSKDLATLLSTQNSKLKFSLDILSKRSPSEEERQQIIEEFEKTREELEALVLTALQ